ncbi:MAG TPA: hypothetical protein VN495_02600 [Candidatus Paceibacterota bacterium]|nr:hypothetical protein [Candidatus Paceibacterota bacterium]
MASGADLKSIAQARLVSAETLMSAGDWHAAAYMLPYSLECALKSVICKTLHLGTYPDDQWAHEMQVQSFFTTHIFVQLIVVSGLTDIFSPTGRAEPYGHWSKFTAVYPGKWIGMRYNDTIKMAQFDEKKVRELHFMLTDPQHGILTVIENEGRW